MSKLFDITSINGMILNNRFVRSATWEGMAGDYGTPASGLIDMMIKLVKGGVGLIITSHAYVLKNGKAAPWQLGIYNDQLVPGLSKMVEEVHKNEGKIVVQISHGGLYANSKLTGEVPFAPSAVSNFSKVIPHEMTQQDIQNIVEAFGISAKRARTAGFDGIQIHAAHGYLLSQFLSPAFNKRKDDYGGSIENRVRIIQEVLNAIRKNVGDDFPVLIKMNCQDFIDGGLILDDSIKAGALLKAEGIDAIELSGGTFLSGKNNPSRKDILSEKDEAYFEDAARTFRDNIDIPLILVGGIRSFNIAENIIDSNIADYISMCRPFIREPGLIKRWKSGDRNKATCLSDSKCFIPARKGKGIYCMMEKKD